MSSNSTEKNRNKNKDILYSMLYILLIQIYVDVNF